MADIRIESVDKTYEMTGDVVRPLDLEIPAGEFLALLGPSGCGKSTLLRMVAGLEAPTHGRILRDPKDRISFVFQEPQLLPWRNVLENVRLPLELVDERSTKERDEHSRQALIRVGLGEALEKMPHQLSGGMKMRVSLARALVTEPRILLLDEPFGALDEVTRYRLQEDLRSFWRAFRMTVIFVTHSMSEAAFLAERQIVFSGRPARVVADRRSLLGAQRGDALRLSPEFANEVRELQQTFRSSEEYP